MKHRVAGRKLGRTSEHRLALLRNLSTQLFDKERIRTTLMKAKELRPFAEKLITVAKKESLHARRQVLRHIHDRAVVGKLFDSLAARFAERPGGYTRIVKLGPRRGDNAEMAIIELVDARPVAEAAEKPQKGAKRKPAKTTEPAAEPAKAEEPAAKPTKKKAAKKAAKKKTTKKAVKAKPAPAEGGAKKKAAKKAAKKKTTKKS